MTTSNRSADSKAGQKSQQLVLQKRTFTQPGHENCQIKSVQNPEIWLLNRDALGLDLSVYVRCFLCGRAFFRPLYCDGGVVEGAYAPTRICAWEDALFACASVRQVDVCLAISICTARQSLWNVKWWLAACCSDALLVPCKHMFE